MAHVIRVLYNGYVHYFDEFKGMHCIARVHINQHGQNFQFVSDPRVEEYPMLGSPIPIACLIVGYLYFVKNLGPKLMENRKPFELNNVMIAYNFIQIVANLWLGVYVSILSGY